MQGRAASRRDVVIPGPLAGLILGVAELFQPPQVPCLPDAGCGAIIHGMKSAQHQGAIADHPGGARSDMLYRALQP
ncbi:MAG: hypothetical protein IPF50_08465 [Proteobacteria bacterium]|nr:hypothetical protein [Pseudomonadota bacterium]